MADTRPGIVGIDETATQHMFDARIRNKFGMDYEEIMALLADVQPNVYQTLSATYSFTGTKMQDQDAAQKKATFLNKMILSSFKQEDFYGMTGDDDGKAWLATLKKMHDDKAAMKQ